MNESAVYHPHPEEPAQALLRPEATGGGGWAGLTAQRFEVVSRGDFVPGILYLPDSSPATPAPLLLLQHGAGEGKDSARLVCAAPWVQRGLAVATIDLPLHGERESAKFSERLVQGFDRLGIDSRLDPETRVLVEEFACQSTSDLIRTLDALCALPEIDGDRVGFMGFGLGAVTGTYLVAHDPRPRVAILAYCRSGVGPPELDPATYLANPAGKPNPSVLIVSVSRDDPGAENATNPLFDAIPEPKKYLRVPSGSDPLPEEVVDEIWRLLSKELSL